MAMHPNHHPLIVRRRSPLFRFFSIAYLTQAIRRRPTRSRRTVGCIRTQHHRSGIHFIQGTVILSFFMRARIPTITYIKPNASLLRRVGIRERSLVSLRRCALSFRFFSAQCFTTHDVMFVFLVHINCVMFIQLLVS